MSKKPSVLRRKCESSRDFGDILASLDRRASEKVSAAVHSANNMKPGKEPEPEAKAAEPPPVRNRLRRLLGNIALPWPSGISSLIGFGPRSAAPYAEEAAEAQNTSPAAPPHARPEAIKPEPVKAEPEKTEDQAIAEELGLTPGLGTIDLQRIRRDFAKKNHPDRFALPQRINAQRRMSIANMLIDEHMRQIRSSSR